MSRQVARCNHILPLPTAFAPVDAAEGYRTDIHAPMTEAVGVVPEVLRKVVEAEHDAGYAYGGRGEEQACAVRDGGGLGRSGTEGRR